MTEYVSLKPNRELLNAKFESYHLGSVNLQTQTKSFLQPVAYYPLTDEHYSFSHLRAHAEQNLLVLDLWNKEQDILYFIDESYAVMGLPYNKADGTFGSPVTMCKFPEPSKDKIMEHISPSIAFPSCDTCLINDGAGKLYICETANRGSALEKQNWSREDMTLIKDFGEPFYLRQCCLHEEDTVFCMLMSLEDEKKSATSHPKVSLHLLEYVQNCKGSNSAGDRFIVKSLKTLMGASVPLYASYGPDFSTVIIASQKVFSYDVKEKVEAGETTNGSAESSKDKEEKAEEIRLSETDAAPTTYTNEQMEECDMVNEEDVKLYVVDRGDGSVKLETPVAGHQWLFSRIFTPQEPTSFCIRHDVDGVLWKPVQSDTTSKVSWKHVSTFNALGFIQASKKNHKYTICGADYEFVAIVDCASNIYIYLTNNLSSKDGSQFVIELPTEDEVLGVQASKTTLFLLTKNSMFAVKVL